MAHPVAVVAEHPRIHAVRDAITCYPRDAIVDAFAIFTGKHTPARYPTASTRDICSAPSGTSITSHQAEPITKALIRERRREGLGSMPRWRRPELTGAATPSSA